MYFLELSIPLHAIALIAAWAFVGAGFKYIDQVYDAQIFSRRVAWMLVPLVGLVMGILIISDYYSAELMLALILGLAIASKFDNLAFRSLVLISLLVPTVYSILAGNSLISDLRWLSVFALTCATLADEYIDDYLDVFLQKKNIHWVYKRPVLPIMLLLTVLSSFLPLTNLLALLAFDAAYLAVATLSVKIEAKALSMASL